MSALIAETTFAKLEREVAELKVEAAAGTALRGERPARSRGPLHRGEGAGDRTVAAATTKKCASSSRRERERILKHLLPKRYAMAGTAQVFPVAIEIRLPAVGGRA